MDRGWGGEGGMDNQSADSSGNSDSAGNAATGVVSGGWDYNY